MANIPPKNNTELLKKLDIDNRYLISSNGYVISNARNTQSILKNSIANNGYYVVNIKNSPRLLHRLLAIAFIENPDNKREVNHKDGNKLNNNIDNLEWVSSKENKIHAWNMNLCESIRENLSKKVMDTKTGIIYNSAKDAAKVFGIKYTSIKEYLNDKRKTKNKTTLRYYENA